MNAKQVFIAAAELIDAGEEYYSCHALESAQGLCWVEHSTLRRTYEDWLTNPRNKRSLCARFDQSAWPEAKQHRVIALLFFAAIAETGDFE